MKLQLLIVECLKRNSLTRDNFHHRSSDIFLKDEDKQIITLDQDKIKEETISLLKKICQSDVGTNYKLGKAHRFLNLNIYK